MAGHDDFELTQPRRVILARIFRLATPYRGWLAAGVALGLLTAGLTLAQPYVLGSGITEALAAVGGTTGVDGGWSDEALWSLVRIMALFLVVSAAGIGVRYANEMLMVHFRMKVLTDLRRKIYRKILRQSFTYFDRQDTGQLINRTIGDVNMLRMFYTMVLVRGSEVVLFLLGALAALVWIDVYVAAVAMLFIPLYSIAIYVFADRIHPRFHEMRHELDEATQILSENVQGIQVVRAFGREPEEARRYDKAIRGVLTGWNRIANYFAIYQPAVIFIGQAGLLAMVGVMSFQAIRGLAEVGLIYTVFRWAGQLTNSMGMIARMTGTLQHSLVSAERVFEILDADRKVRSPGEPAPMPEGRGRVIFENVTFAYDGDEAVLHEVNLDIPAGTNVALVGPTGSGKSTLIKLLPRFYDPTEGRILLDGVDIRELDLDALRAEIGFVFQDTFLFSASLEENIAFGVPEAECRAVEEAARRARVNEFAERFTEGYETAVGERGISLSGGQRQRVAIARALLTDPRVLILDDATASVDATTERAIQDGLAEVMENRTTFIIAHRVSTVKQADLVLVVEGGRIVEQGSHEALLARGGPYKTFVEMQWQLGLDEPEEVA